MLLNSRASVTDVQTAMLGIDLPLPISLASQLFGAPTVKWYVSGRLMDRSTLPDAAATASGAATSMIAAGSVSRLLSSAVSLVDGGYTLQLKPLLTLSNLQTQSLLCNKICRGAEKW